MELRINGEARQFDTPLTVAGLLDVLGVPRDRVAVELNRTIVPRARHPETPLAHGDEVELVTFVGGG